jgi:hypothetical protein
MEDKKEERRGFVRLPLTLYVDGLEFEPDVFYGRTVRSAYDLELTTYDMKKLHDELGKRLNDKILTPMRIRVIGRLVS